MFDRGTRRDDIPPMRAVGPVTTEEYESRADLYDKQLKEAGFDINGKSVDEKLGIIRKYRYDQYYKLMEVAYERRGWTKNGVPKIERLEELGIALPELVEIIKGAQ